MSTLRLLAITTSQEEGGAESHLRTTLAAARARGCEVHVALPPSPRTLRLRKQLRDAGCILHVVPVGLQAGSKVGSYLALARDALFTLWAITCARPNTVLLNLPTPEATPGAMVACALARVQTTTVFHLVRPDLTVTARRRALYRCAARRSQRWICVSEDNRRTLGDQFGVEEQRISVVRNGVAPKNVRPGAGEHTRASLEVSATATLVLTTGRLGAQKDHNVIVEALPHLVALDKRLTFVWAGDGPLYGALARAVAATGLEQHVRLLGSRDDIPDLLAAADLFLMPSRYEGGAPPFALAEAMLAGVPAIVSDIEPLREIIEDGRNGLAFACGDPTDLVRVISLALTNRPMLKKMALSAREQASREFMVERMTKGLLAHILR